VKILPKNAFENFTGFNIKISHHNLSSIEANIFEGCQNLENLTLSNNSLGILDSKSLDNLKNSTSRLEKLGYLDLSKNGLTYVPLVNKRYPKLHILDLSDNNIEFLNTSQAFWRTIIKLKLNRNKIKKISADFFGDSFKYIRNLYLKHNEISEVSNIALAGLQNLQKIDLSENRLNHIVFITNTRLKTIIQANQFKDKTYDSSGKIETFNKLESFAFYQTRLDVLHMHKLDLSHNSIKSVDKRAFCMDRKKFGFHYDIIDLRHNPLSEVDSCTFYALKEKLNNTNVTTLHLPLVKCNCHITNLNRFFKVDGNCSTTDGKLKQMSKYNCNNFNPNKMCQGSKWEYDCDIDEKEISMRSYVAAIFDYRVSSLIFMIVFWFVAITGFYIIYVVSARKKKLDKFNNQFE
jgi:hypothetical protein